MLRSHLQWNLDLTSLYVTKVLGIAFFVHTPVAMGILILVLQNSVATLIAGQTDLWPKGSLWISFCWSRSY